MNVLITGVSRGLGKVLFEDFLLKGHLVIGCARSKISAQYQDQWYQNTQCLYIDEVDFSSQETLKKLYPHLSSTDVLINNVGIAADGLLATQAEDKIAEIIQVNLTSTLILTKNYVRERLKAKKAGIIVNISSIIGIRGYAGLAAYSASKAGLDGMTRSLARELGPKGFRINSVLPGYIKTDMSQNLSYQQKETIIRRTPLGRLAAVEDIIPVVEFLISDGAKFITGQSIVVDGGITV